MTGGPSERRRVRRAPLLAVIAIGAAVAAGAAGLRFVVASDERPAARVRGTGAGGPNGEISVPSTSLPRPSTTSTPPATSMPVPATSTPAAPATVVPATTPPLSPTTTAPAPPVWVAPADCLGLYDVDVGAGTARRVLAERVQEPSWSPDASRIAFQRTDTDTDTDTDEPREWLAVMNADGRGQRTIRAADGADYDALQWDPDGAHVWAIERVVQSDGTTADRIVRVDTATGAGTELRPEGLPDDAHLSNLSVSPAGDRVAYGDSDVTIAVMNADGSDVVELARDVRWVGPFVWSPDGETVGAFLHEPEPGIFLYAADGSGSRRLVDSGGDMVSIGGWSPDGRLFAFSRIAGGGAVEVVGTDGRDHRVLAAGSTPEWSPDGEWLAFAAPTDRAGDGGGEGARSERRETHVIRPDGTGQRVVIDGSTFEEWSPDGGRLLSRCGGPRT